MKFRFANMLEYRKYVGNRHSDCSFVEMDPTGRYGRVSLQNPFLSVSFYKKKSPFLKIPFLSVYFFGIIFIIIIRVQNSLLKWLNRVLEFLLYSHMLRFLVLWSCGFESL